MEKDYSQLTNAGLKMIKSLVEHQVEETLKNLNGESHEKALKELIKIEDEIKSRAVDNSS